MIGRSSIALIAIPPNKKSVIYIRNTADAVFTVSSSTRRLISSALSFFRKTERAEENKTAIVVVFIPPAVEPGEPPISIRIIMKYNPVSPIAVRSAVLNPAVLGVTD